jgi:enoyl-CoA hydratase
MTGFGHSTMGHHLPVSSADPRSPRSSPGMVDRSDRSVPAQKEPSVPLSTTTRARFAWNFAHRGLVPDTGAGSWLLPRLIGTSQAFWLLYSGEFISAREAHELKFVSGVFEPEELEDRTRDLTEVILQGSPFSHQRIKSLVYEGLGNDVSAHMVNHTRALKECFGSDDHKEGVASFLERRPASFTGK